MSIFSKYITILLLSFASLQVFYAQCSGNNTFLGTTNNSWSTASNWSANCVPNGTVDGDIIIASNCVLSSFTLVSFTGGFQINAGKTFTLSGSASLEFIGTVSGSGTFIGNQQIDGALYPGDFGPLPPQTGTITYGGQTYNTILMPDGKWWMAENLNIGTMIQGNVNMTNNNVIQKYCYDNDPANCDIYGGLYQWNEMMQYTTTQGVQGICPTGWHVPTFGEWTALEAVMPSPDKGSRLAGNALLWNNGALDQSQYFGESGFKILAGGVNFVSYFDNQNIFSYSYSSSTNGGWALMINLYYDLTEIDPLHNADKTYGCSVRCVQN